MFDQYAPTNSKIDINHTLNMFVSFHSSLLIDPCHKTDNVSHFLNSLAINVHRAKEFSNNKEFRHILLI